MNQYLTSIQKKIGITGNQVKIIGIILMIFDHIHQMFWNQGVPEWFSWIGRPAAPIFLFMCAEGFYYTRKKSTYMVRLLMGFFLMNFVSGLVSRVFPSEIVLINNIFSTLFLCTVYMLAVDLIKRGQKLKGIGLMLLPVLTSVLVLVILSMEQAPALLLQLTIFIPNLLTVEGGFLFVILGVLFYLFRNSRILQCSALVLLSLLVFLMGNHAQGYMIFAVIPLILYNGQRGGGNKYFFYIFYPAHIYLLYMAAWFISSR